MHKRPAADKFIKEARKLRGQNFPEEKLKGAVWAIYSDSPNRARLMRACLASAQSFRRAQEVYHRGGNVVTVVAALTRRSAAGAPKGNMNARGKRRYAPLARLQGTWDAITRAQQDEFLRENNLQRKRDRL